MSSVKTEAPSASRLYDSPTLYCALLSQGAVAPAPGPASSRAPAAGKSHREEERVSSVVKKRRKKMRKHKHRKMLKKTRWQRKHKG